MTDSDIRVLLITGDAEVADRTRRLLLGPGRPFVLEHVDRPGRGLTRLDKPGSDVVLLALDPPDRFGLETLSEVTRRVPQVPVVVLGSRAEDSVAVQAIREGAQDFLTAGDLDRRSLERAIRYAVERSRLQQSLRSMTLEDDLTGLYNRRGFRTLAEQQIRLAHRQLTPLLLVFADLDGLKAINDRHGHLTGSRAIIAASRVLRQTFRESDIVARFGGDEFIVLLPEAGEDDFAKPAARLQHNLDTFNQRSGNPWQLAISLGSAAYDPAKPCPLEEVIERADRAMYAEKKRRYKARRRRAIHENGRS